MNYWYAPVTDSQSHVTPRLPPDLIAAVAAPWRSTKELEAVRDKARNLAHYDMAGAAQSILTSRKQKEAKGAVKALHHGQLVHQLQTETAALEALTAVNTMWGVHLEQLRQDACGAVRALQERHEDELTRLRLDQVTKAHQSGIRPERRSRELLNLRRSESVLAARNNFTGAASVKAHADELAASEACSAHAAWLLRCHGEQERLMGRQRRELEALRAKMDSRLRDVEAARDNDLEKLQRKIKAVSLQQRHGFTRERRSLEQALSTGSLINTRTTRPGRGLADALPTLAAAAAELAAAKAAAAATAARKQLQQQPDGEQASSAGPLSASAPGTGYLGPSSGSGGAQGRAARSDGPAAATLGVRFAPTPPRREAWGPVGSTSANGRDGAASVKSCSRSTSSRSDNGSEGERSRPSSSSSSSGKGSEGSWSNQSVDGDQPQQSRSPSSPFNRPAIAGPSQVQAAPAQGEERAQAGGAAALGSATTAAATGSGSSALTEEALRAMNRAAGARLTDMRRGASSLQSSSFKSNKPYAGGVSARAMGRPPVAPAGAA